MKVFKKVIAWAMLSIILQVGVLYFLNNVVFKHTSEFKSNILDLKKDNTKDIKASISAKAENINISYNGKYLSYKEDDNLFLEDTKTGKSTQITTQDKGTILYYDWLPERDILVIAEKVEKSGKSKIQIITYNAVNETETLVKEMCTYQDNMKIKKISASIFTGVYYVDIDKGGSKDTVYRIDRNNDMQEVNLKTYILGNIQVIPHADRLIYADKIKGTFYVTSPNKQLNFNSNKKLTLLGIDRNDVVYMGELNGDKITNITYGKVDEDTSTWKKVALDSVVNSDDIYFNNKSEILVNDNLKGSVKNLTSGSEVEYEGKLIQIKEGFIATVDNDGKLVYKNLNTK
ncbi:MULTISPECIES: DPP IV N-terminal domain-containing protein [unclassified Clostridium]|uniref:DPP IV N-terminal domain-containing protein n=1 Tax=unclassified Clostridium TaxID=2614128 RepID=UPI0002977674|nr:MULTISPECIES: DPP IV N-terminal domain-containing protein [unclassified Clostridium]EKQ53851.1 MAG: Dipeptidyl peptidase IV (DPP IV) [Clostridium sp. Maddingley MBC34-26]